MRKHLGNAIFIFIVILLVGIILGQFGFIPVKLIVVRSGSMQPTLYPGDVVVVYIDKSQEVKPDDVIYFKMNGIPIIHRAVEVKDGAIITKGDANECPDQQPVYQSEGKIVFSIPKVGYLFASVQSFIAPVFSEL